MAGNICDRLWQLSRCGKVAQKPTKSDIKIKAEVEKWDQISLRICHCACTLNDMCIKDKGSFRIRYCCWYMVVEIWRVEEHTTKHYIRLLTTAQVDFSRIIIGYTADPNLTISFKILDHLVWRNFISFLSGSRKEYSNTLDFEETQGESRH